MLEMRCLKHPTKKVCNYYDYLREQINERASECLDAGLINGIHRFDLGNGNITWDFTNDYKGTWFDRYIYIEADSNEYNCNINRDKSDNNNLSDLLAFIKNRRF